MNTLTFSKRKMFKNIFKKINLTSSTFSYYNSKTYYYVPLEEASSQTFVDELLKLNENMTEFPLWFVEKVLSDF